MSDHPPKRKLSADEHAAHVLEMRNRAFRVLYDTVLEVESVPDDRIHEVLCGNLRSICDTQGALLFSYDPISRSLTLRACRDQAETLTLADLEGVSQTIPLTKQWKDRLTEAPIKIADSEHPCFELLCKYVPSLKAEDGKLSSNMHTLSCMRDGELMAVGLVWDEPDSKLKVKDVIKTYLNLMGMILQRIDAVMRLRESEAYVKSILDSMSVAIMVIDPKTHTIIDVNTTAEELIQAKRDELKGQECFGLVCGSERGACPITDFGQQCNMSQRGLRTVSGETIPVLKGVTSVSWGGQQYLIETLTDIRDRLRVEDELQKAVESAKTANQAKSEFLANMSHEIRTPMTAILGFTENLLDEELSEADRINAVQTIQRNGKHLLEIINDILDLSKLEAGKLEIERIDCSLTSLLHEVCDLMRVRADASNLPLHLEFAGSVPSTICSDPTRIKQVLVNLIGNAIKFTKKGCVRLIASATGEKDDITIQIDVVDTGIGITQEQADKLFQPFSQADASTSRRFGGTGLGLTISTRLAELLGGSIKLVESKPNEGTRFRMTFGAGCPRKQQTDRKPESPCEKIQTVPSSMNDAAKGPFECKILVAEDGPDNQILIKHILKKQVSSVTIVENGKLAVEAVTQAEESGEGFDLILMDMQMPEMDGYEATQHLRENGFNRPILALTANAMKQDRELCLQAGCNEHITKPIDRKRLIETICRYLQHKLQPTHCGEVTCCSTE